VADQSDNLRASDADRQRVADRLQQSLNEGRLTLAEYDERVRQSYEARTYGDLKALLTDLPASQRQQLEPVTSKPPARDRTGRWVLAMWSSWLTTALVVIVIWALSGRGYFWPGWVIGPWGALLLASTISGIASGAPRRYGERRRRHHRD
jgi:hypothetical protein